MNVHLRRKIHRVPEPHNGVYCSAVNETLSDTIEERYAPLTYYEDVLEASRYTLMARNAGKYAISLHTCISITDKAKINEQNKSIAVGPFYIGTYFEPIWTLLPEDVAVLNPTGYRTLKRRYPACVRHQNGFSHIVMVWYVVLKIGT